MPQPNFMLLYVDSPPASARFYSGLLGCEPIEASPTFVLFALESGLKLGLWARRLVEPTVSAAPGAAEIAIPVEEPASVEFDPRGLAGARLAYHSGADRDGFRPDFCRP